MSAKFSFLLLIGFSVFTACKTSKIATDKTSTVEPKEDMTILNKKWQLIELNQKEVATKINGKEVFIQFEDDDRYTASGGCNGMGGSFEISSPNRIKFSQGMSTMMACKDMTIESGLKKVLESVDNFTVKDSVLSLNKARMAPLARFKLVDNITPE